jgi:hypothetical protein
MMPFVSSEEPHLHTAGEDSHYNKEEKANRTQGEYLMNKQRFLKDPSTIEREKNETNADFSSVIVSPPLPSHFCSGSVEQFDYSQVR